MYCPEKETWLHHWGARFPWELWLVPYSQRHTTLVLSPCEFGPHRQRQMLACGRLNDVIGGSRPRVERLVEQARPNLGHCIPSMNGAKSRAGLCSLVMMTLSAFFGKNSTLSSEAIKIKSGPKKIRVRGGMIRILLRETDWRPGIGRNPLLCAGTHIRHWQTVNGISTRSV